MKHQGQLLHVQVSGERSKGTLAKMAGRVGIAEHVRETVWTLKWQCQKDQDLQGLECQTWKCGRSLPGLQLTVLLGPPRSLVLDAHLC